MKRHEKNIERDSLILEMYSEGWGTSYIVDKLAQEGYGKISKARVWNIYRMSGTYRPKQNIVRFCNFCNENKDRFALYNVNQYGKPALKRICLDCINKHVKEEPIKID